MSLKVKVMHMKIKFQKKKKYYKIKRVNFLNIVQINCDDEEGGKREKEK